MKDIDVLMYAFAFLFTLGLTILLGRLIIPILKEKAEQPIYTDGPSWHIQKAGTPTMGGICFLSAITSTLCLTALYKYVSGDKYSAASLFICTLYALLNASVGIIDDITKLLKKENAGLTPRAKLILQFILSVLFLLSRNMFLNDGTAIVFSFSSINFGFLYYIIALIILIGITNCANLTDGIDGLASSVAFAIAISLFYFSFGFSDNAAFITIALAAGTIGFLTFNLHPAKIFMGDTGSLYLGALVAAIAFELKNPFIAVLSGGVYVIEGISVILQVVFYKMTRKRLFRMAPIHHHLEKCGWDENRICIAGMLLTLIFSSLVLSLCAR